MKTPLQKRHCGQQCRACRYKNLNFQVPNRLSSLTKDSYKLKKQSAVFQLYLIDYSLRFLIRLYEKTALSYTVGASNYYWCTLWVTILAVCGICVQKMSDIVGAICVLRHTLWVATSYLVMSWA